jgi:hypothetical protein
LGYVFQFALLYMSNHATENANPIYNLLDSSLAADFYSYSSLSLANNNRSALVDAEVLTNISQTVYGTFFQKFLSDANDEFGYWAYQVYHDALPADLVQEPTTRTTISVDAFPEYKSKSVTTTSTDIIPPSSDCPGDIECVNYTQTEIETITDTQSPATGTSYISATFTEIVLRSTSSLGNTPIPIITPTATSIDFVIPDGYYRLASAKPSTVKATISNPETVLAVSSLALFFSIGILAFLIVCTVFVYTTLPRTLRYLPQDLDSPASALAFVYGSEKLQAWVREQNELGQLNRYGESKRLFGKGYKAVNAEIKIGMGYFYTRDGVERWGFEIQGEEDPRIHEGIEEAGEGTEEADAGTEEANVGIEEADEEAEQADDGIEVADEETEEGNEVTEEASEGNEEADEGIEEAGEGIRAADERVDSEP